MPTNLVKAQDQVPKAAVSIGMIDYDSLSMQVNMNGNTIAYYSNDKTSWYEVEGSKTTDNVAIIMDISWVPDDQDKTLYFKGDSVSTVISITLPAKETTFKAIYNKADCDFTFQNNDEALNFQWRKMSDYTWHTVSFDTASASYQEFLRNMEGLLLKGGKVNFRLPQIAGKSEVETGVRPSKEIAVTLAKRSDAPSVKVNVAKLNLTTTESMEYYSETLKAWVDCDKNMLIQDIAPATLYKNGAKSVTIMIRTQATATKSYSKTAYLTIPGQKAAPSIGGSSSDLSYFYQNKKLVLQFNQASKTNIYSYAIVKPGDTFDVSTARFNTIATSKSRAIAMSTAPEGAVIYIRKQGINDNPNRNISLELSSEVTSFTVSYK